MSDSQDHSDAAVQLPIHEIESTCFVLGSDLAQLYRVSPQLIKEAVKRNPMFFPEGSLCYMRREEYFLRSIFDERQNLDVPKEFWKHPAFTATGLVMLPFILKGWRAKRARAYFVRNYLFLLKAVFNDRIKAGDPWPDLELKKKDPEIYDIHNSIFRVLEKQFENRKKINS